MVFCSFTGHQCINMKKYFLVILIFFSFKSYCQLNGKIKCDQGKKIYFSGTVDVAGTNKNNLYWKTLQFCTDYFDINNASLRDNSFNDSCIITNNLAQDRDSGLIIMRGWCHINKGVLGIRSILYFDLKIQVKDNGYRYKFYNIWYTLDEDKGSKFPQDLDSFNDLFYYDKNMVLKGGGSFINDIVTRIDKTELFLRKYIINNIVINN
jgi:hypothetical protein